MSDCHLAQINIAHARESLESPVMQGFVARLDEINSLAEQSPGFIWRLEDDSGDATAMHLFDDPLIIINMSVWSSLETLKSYVYRTRHVELIRKRDAWFTRMPESHMALWWVTAGHIPSPAEGREKLALLRREGPGPQAFTFAQAFPEPGH